MGINCCNVTLHLYRTLSFQNIICDHFVSNGIARLARLFRAERPIARKASEASFSAIYPPCEACLWIAIAHFN